MEERKYFRDCKLTKLKEFSNGYGREETILIPFICETENSVITYNKKGDVTRRYNKKTNKVLKSFVGIEIKETTFLNNTQVFQKLDAIVSSY